MASLFIAMENSSGREDKMVHLHAINHVKCECNSHHQQKSFNIFQEHLPTTPNMLPQAHMISSTDEILADPSHQPPHRSASDHPSLPAYCRL